VRVDAARFSFLVQLRVFRAVLERRLVGAHSKELFTRPGARPARSTKKTEEPAKARTCHACPRPTRATPARGQAGGINLPRDGDVAPHAWRVLLYSCPVSIGRRSGGSNGRRRPRRGAARAQQQGACARAYGGLAPAVQA
jgi:hypothetical protein